MSDTMDIKTMLYLMQMNISKAYRCHNEYILTEDCCCCNECPMNDHTGGCLLRFGYLELDLTVLLNDSDLKALIPKENRRRKEVMNDET